MIDFVVRPKARANAAIATPEYSFLEGCSIERVECRSLDSLVSELNLDKIALLKIDTEGHEMGVIEGAKKILSEVRPYAILFEVCPELTRRAGFDAEAPAAALEAAGYLLSRIGDGGRLEPVRPSDAAHVALENWVALDARADQKNSAF